MRPTVTEVFAKEKYVIHVTFADGTSGNYDLSHLAGKGVFKAWDEDDNFFKVFTSDQSGAITWPGELDIDTITIYCSIREIGVDQYLTAEHAQVM